MSMRSVSNFITMLLALAGCIVAIVLTYEEFHPAADIGCSQLGGDCARTIQSAYGHLGPIPTSIFGLGMYAAVVGLCVVRKRALRARRAMEQARVETYAQALDAQDQVTPVETVPDPILKLRSRIKRLDAALWGIAVLAVVTSWWLQYVSLYVICSFCPWCFGSASIVTLIFLLTTYDFLLEGRKLDGEQKLLAGVTAFILICFGFVGAPVLISRAAECRKTTVALKPRAIEVSKRDMLLVKYLNFKGDPGAKYTLVEFADYQCPHCKKAAGVVDELMKKQPPGGVRLGFRNFPLSQHDWARPAALAAEAAGEQGKFWQMHDLIFEHQDELEKPTFTRETLDQWAEQLGLDLKKFSRDFDSKKLSDRIINDAVAGQITELKTTPTFYLITPTQITQMPGIERLQQAWRDHKDPVWK